MVLGMVRLILMCECRCLDMSVVGLLSNLLWVCVSFIFEIMSVVLCMFVILLLLIDIDLCVCR